MIKASQNAIRLFLTNATERMQQPIRDYFDVIRRYGQGSLQASVAQSLTNASLERVLRSIHTQAAVLGAAGDLNQSAREILADIISQDTDYLTSFMRDLPRLSEQQALNRAALYANTAKGTVSDIATLELPTLPVYPRDANKLDCGWHCRCAIDVRYLFGEGNYNVFWQLDQRGGIEHCDDCLRLSRVWRPLKIRNNKIVSAKQMTEHDLYVLKAALLRIAA